MKAILITVTFGLILWGLLVGPAEAWFSSSTLVSDLTAGELKELIIDAIREAGR